MYDLIDQLIFLILTTLSDFLRWTLRVLISLRNNHLLFRLLLATPTSINAMKRDFWGDLKHFFGSHQIVHTYFQFIDHDQQLKKSIKSIFDTLIDKSVELLNENFEPLKENSVLFVKIIHKHR